jgi:hypothetical protein
MKREIHGIDHGKCDPLKGRDSENEKVPLRKNRVSNHESVSKASETNSVWAGGDWVQRAHLYIVPPHFLGSVSIYGTRGAGLRFPLGTICGV